MTDRERQHARELIAEILQDATIEGVALIQIDGVCCWDDGRGKCGSPLWGVSACLMSDDVVQVAAYCKHHVEIVNATLHETLSAAEQQEPVN